MGDSWNAQTTGETMIQSTCVWLVSAGDIPLLVGEIQFVAGWVRMSSPTLDR